MTTTFEIPLNYAPVSTPENVLVEIYCRASEAIDEHQLVFAYCNMFIEVSPERTAFAEVQINTETSNVVYYVTSSDNTARKLPALNYTQAIRQLRSLMR
jgi:hypothetical protein